MTKGEIAMPAYGGLASMGIGLTLTYKIRSDFYYFSISKTFTYADNDKTSSLF
jgi:hypothetical protein